MSQRMVDDFEDLLMQIQEVITSKPFTQDRGLAAIMACFHNATSLAAMSIDIDIGVEDSRRIAASLLDCLEKNMDSLRN